MIGLCCLYLRYGLILVEPAILYMHSMYVRVLIYESFNQTMRNRTGERTKGLQKSGSIWSRTDY